MVSQVHRASLASVNRNGETGPRLVAAIAVSFFLLLTGALPSAAAGYERDNVAADGWGIGRDLCSVGFATSGSDAYAVACFQPDGDKLNVADGLADGSRVAMSWKVGSRSGICVNSRGREATFSSYKLLFSGDYGCDKDFPESAIIFFRVGRCNASKVNCSTVSNWHWEPFNSYRVDGNG